MGHALGSTQRNRATNVKRATPHKYVKSPLASPADTLAPEEEDSVPLTKEQDSETNDLPYPSRRVSGHRLKSLPGSWDVPKSGTGSGINIRTTELGNLEQTEELLTGVQGDTRALADYCDQLFNPVKERVV